MHHEQWLWALRALRSVGNKGVREGRERERVGFLPLLLGAGRTGKRPEETVVVPVEELGNGEECEAEKCHLSQGSTAFKKIKCGRLFLL